MNNVNLVGRLTKDIEIKATTNNKLVTAFTLAVYRDKEHSDFINCVAWNGTAELLQKYTQKGSRIGVNGRIQTRSYDNSEGKKVYVTEVFVDKVELLDSKKDASNETIEPNVEPSQTINISPDDLPFY